MPDPPCHPPRSLAAAIVPVRRFADGWRGLVLQPFRHWDFPKGAVEADESPRETALREARKEATLDDLRFTWGEACANTAPCARGKVARYFLAESPGARVALAPSPEPGRPEHHDLRRVSFGAAATLPPPRLQPVLAWARDKVTG